jgi:molybdopterin-synthase adenylyltransferase
MNDEMHAHEKAHRTPAAMQKMAGTRVVVCGAGALGANIVDSLARCGFKDIAVIDFDRVQYSNLGTQPYSIVDCGSKKVMALGNIVEEATGTVIECIDKKLDERNAAKLLVGELVIDVFDNSDSRRIVHEVCLEKGIPCLHAGMADGFAKVEWNEGYRVPGDRKGDDPCEYPLARTLVVIASAMALEAAIRFATDGSRPQWMFTVGDMKLS